MDFKVLGIPLEGNIAAFGMGAGGAAQAVFGESGAFGGPSASVSARGIGGIGRADGVSGGVTYGGSPGVSPSRFDSFGIGDGASGSKDALSGIAGQIQQLLSVLSSWFGGLRQAGSGAGDGASDGGLAGRPAAARASAGEMSPTGDWPASGRGQAARESKRDTGIQFGNASDGRNAADVARHFLGQRTDALVRSGQLNMDNRWGPSSDCADFASAAMEKAGKLPAREHQDDTRQMYNYLRNKGWHETNLSNAKIGDPVFFNGAYHTELFAGYDSRGQPTFVGSNNINRDGTQSISMRHGWYGGARVLTQG
jgi:hypothetical protein